MTSSREYLFRIKTVVNLHCRILYIWLFHNLEIILKTLLVGCSLTAIPLLFRVNRPEAKIACVIQQFSWKRNAASQSLVDQGLYHLLLKFEKVCSRLLSPSPPTFNLHQHQGLFKWVSSSIRWSKYWSFSFSISPSNDYSGLISFRMDWLDLLAVQGTL